MKRIFSLLFLLTLLSAHGFGLGYEGVKPTLGAQINCGDPLARGLVGCWLMNEGSGNKVYDLAKNLNLSFNDLSIANWGLGKYGSVLENKTGGAAGIVSDGFTTRYVGMPGLTISLWFYSNGNQANSARLVEYGYDKNFAFGATNNSLFFYLVTDAGSGNDTSMGTFSHLAWHHAVVFWRASDGAYDTYIDGVKQNLGSTRTGSVIGTSTATFLIGYIDGTQNWNGKIDNISIWNHALTATEVLQLYMTPFRMFEREPIELWSAAGAEEPTMIYDYAITIGP